MSKSNKLDYSIIKKENSHIGWDNSLDPVLTVEPGKDVLLQMEEASGGQISLDSTVDDVITLDFDKVNPVTGPIYIEGAAPGDILVVNIKEFIGAKWGWTANIPGFGLLTDEFPEPFLNISEYDDDFVYYTEEIKIPYQPFPGTIGVAPAESGIQDVVFPRCVGGNMDIRHLTKDSKLYLPVQVDGALFSAGDGHAAQGDGEVCGTAVETGLKMKVGFDLIKSSKIKTPQFETKVLPETNGYNSYVTTGIAPDLMLATKDAIRYMIDYLVREYKLEPVMAYSLCSVAVDLKISEVVDAPNWIVTAHLNKSIFK